MALRTLFAVITASALLFGCSKADLRELRDETEEALHDAGDALSELAGQAEGPIHDSAEQALDVADEARDASREFAENPTTESRQALEAAGRHVDDVQRELEGLVDRAPGGVKDLVQRALDALSDVRRKIDRQLDEG